MSQDMNDDEERKIDILTRYSSNLVESQDYEDTEEQWNIYQENELKTFEIKMVKASRNASACLQQHIKKVANLKGEYENEFPSKKIYMEQTYIHAFDMEHIRWMNRCPFHSSVLQTLIKDCQIVLNNIAVSIITQRPFLIRRIEKMIIQIQSINFFLEKDFQAYNIENFFQPIYHDEESSLYDFGGPPYCQEQKKSNKKTMSKNFESD